MKVLKLYALLCITYSLLGATEKKIDLNSYLSEDKTQEFTYDKQKSDAENSMLHDSWIAPLMLNYSLSKSKPYNKEQTSESASVVWNQDIFRSGGIYYGIKFANASKLYSDLSINLAKKRMIIETISMIGNVLELDLKIKKQYLNIENFNIEVKQKQDLYLNGQLDSSFLDRAIVSKNVATQGLFDLQNQRETLLMKLELYSAKPYKELHLPSLNFMSLEEFMQNNLSIEVFKSSMQKNEYERGVTLAKYLPSIGVNLSYNWSKTQNQQFSPTSPAFSNTLSYYSYGLRASMPLNINTFKDLESSKIGYLKSKLLLKEKAQEQKLFYNEVKNNLININKKAKLASQNIKLYEKLFSQTLKLYKLGYKTQYDKNNMKNSLEIQKLDKKIFALSYKLELLRLYEFYTTKSL